MTEHSIAFLWVPDFGATVARQAGADPGDRPLILLDEQQQVLSADLAAQRRGITVGMSERRALIRCPEALAEAAQRYPVWEAQDDFLTEVRNFAGRWQPAGLGSVYLDTEGIAGDLLSWSQGVVDHVHEQGWQPSLGATGSKYGAWVAGQVAGSNSALLLTPPMQRSFLSRQPVTVLPLAPDAIEQLRHLGIRTLGQFTRLPLAGIITRFGAAGKTAFRWAQGLDDRPVVPPWEAPEVSARLEFEPPLADRTILLNALWKQVQRLLLPLQERMQAISRINLTATRVDGRVLPSTHTFPVPTAAGERVRLALGTAFDRIRWEEQPATEFTVSLAGITDAPCPQLTLFDFDTDNHKRLHKALEHLALRYGETTFCQAALVDPDNLLPERRASWRQ
jgi:nucleotidyltransferase/DNA polymerase involved in DNA repair